MSWLSRVLVLLLATCWMGNAAAKETLSGELLNKTFAPRQGALIPLEFRLNWNGEKILEGYLEVEILKHNETGLRVRSPELVLNPGPRTVILNLPPLEPETPKSMEMNARFVSKTGVVEFGNALGGTPENPGEPPKLIKMDAMVLGVVAPSLAISPIEQSAIKALRFDAIVSRRDEESALTEVSNVNVGELPNRVVDYSRFENVFVPASAFTEAKEKQLAVLGRWIKAGGSVCLFVDPPLQDYHSAFIQNFTKREVPVEGMLRCRAGLGRIVIMRTPSEPFIKSAEWKGAVGFLWKLPQPALEALNRESKLISEQDNASVMRSDGETVWEVMGKLVERRAGAMKIPVVTFFVLLGSLLLVVCPLDYWVLGWLRLRRWTWVLLPVACGLCTWAVAFLVGRVLEKSAGTALIRVVDLAADGRMVRELRYELTFPASDIAYHREVKDGLIQQMRAPDYKPTPVPFLAGSTAQWRAGGLFRLEQTLRQWSPTIHRVTHFPEAMDDSGINWGALVTGGKWQGTKPVGGEYTAYWPEAHGNDCPEPFAKAWGNLSREPQKFEPAQRSPRFDFGIADFANELIPDSIVAWKKVGSEVCIYRLNPAKEEGP